MSTTPKYRIIADSNTSEKVRYALLLHGICQSHYGDLESTILQPWKSTANVRIVKQCCVMGEWLDVTHYVFDNRLEQLQTLKDQRHSLSEQIERLEKELGFQAPQVVSDTDNLGSRPSSEIQQ